MDGGMKAPPVSLIVTSGHPGGSADTLEDAKLIIEAAWRGWLTAAGLSENKEDEGAH